MLSSHLGIGRHVQPPESKVSIAIIGIFCMRNLSILPTYLLFFCSVIYLHQYELINIYFTLGVIIKYHFILLLSLFQHWLLGPLEGVPNISLTYPHHRDFF